MSGSPSDLAPLPPFPFSAKGRALRAEVHDFMRREVAPAEAVYSAQHEALRAAGRQWEAPAVLEELKAKARARGLWNLFLPGCGPDVSNLDYAPLAELMGAVPWASEVFNCSAPDTGNMEVLHRYGSPAQKARWLRPLLDGEIRSAFCMTEPGVASSDATSMALTVRRVPEAEGGGYELNGVKWWASGALDPRCELLIVMGRVADAGSRAAHEHHSMLLVPRRSAGVVLERSLTVFGYDDAPHGHAQIRFENARVGADAVVLGDGRGFEIAQGRLGPGRIHHCMRAVGLAERCLSLLCERADRRVAFGGLLARKDLVRAAAAECRLEIEQARLLVLAAAHAMDAHGNKAARKQIAMIKLVAPRFASRVVDRAMQVHGAAGVSDDFPLARACAGLRTLRIADGPDEVHLLQLGRIELMQQAAAAAGRAEARSRM